LIFKKALQDSIEKFPSLQVEREDNLKYDLGNLLAFDPKPVDAKAFKTDGSKYLMEVARDNVQLLISKIFSLPTESSSGVNGVMVSLPSSSTIIPREKHVPQPLPPTKWETFAKSKGIGKYKPKDKSRMTIDDSTGEVRPKWGYNRANDLKDEWVVESKETDDLTMDPFTQKQKEKEKKVEKHEKSTLANKKRANKQLGPKLPSTIALTADSKKHKEDIDEALSLARKSTVSMGKFDPMLPNEKRTKEKRKFDPVVSDLEKTKNMKVLDKILGPQERRIDMNRAVNQVIQEQQKQKKRVNMEGAKQQRFKKKRK